jgi:hypothetical protein
MNDGSSTDGVRYIPTTEAAERVALSSDYIASLARHGKITAKHIGRQWYVDPTSLNSFLAVQNTLKEQRSAQLSEQLRRVAEKTGTRSRFSAAYPAHARNPSSLIPPEIVEQREPSRFLEKIVAATFAIIFTAGAVAAASPNLRAQADQALNTVTALASLASSRSASLAAAIEPVQNSTSQSPATSSAKSHSQPQSATPIQSATSYTSTIPSAPHGATPPTQSSGNVQTTSFLPSATPTFDVSAFVTQDQLTNTVSALDDSLRQLIQQNYEQPLVSGAEAPIAAVNFAPSQRIDQLNGTTLSNVTVNGVSGLTASDIPALDYFPSSSTISVAYGGTGTSTPPSYGQLLIGNGSGGYALLATSSLGIVGGSATPGGSDTEVQFNNAGAFQGVTSFTFSTSTETLAVTNASTTGFLAELATTTSATSTNLFASVANFTSAVASNLTATFASITGLTATNATTTNATTTNLYVAGTIGLGSALTVASGGTGTSTAPSYGELLVGDGNGGYDLVATSSLGITGGGGNSFSYPFPNNATSTTLTFSSGLLSLASTTIGNGNQNGGLTVAGGATTTGSALFSGAVTLNGATTTASNGFNISSGCFSINGTCVTGGGGSGTVTSITTGTGLTGGAITTSGTIALDLTHANSWTSLQQFQNASTSLFSASGPSYFGSSATSSFNGAGQLTLANLASAVLGVNTSGQVVATTTIGTNLLTGVLGSINDTSLSEGGSIAVTAASSTVLGDNNTFTGNDTFNNTITGSVSGNAGTATALQTARTINGVSFNGTANIIVASTTLLANNNTWTGLQQFANASSTLETDSTLWLPNTTSVLLKTTGSGQVAAAIAGTDYQAPITASYPISLSGNNLSLAFGTTTANTFSQLQTLQGGASTTDISASGEGYFGTASTTNLTVSGAPSGFLQTNAQGAVSATSTFSAGSLFGTLASVNGTPLPANGAITVSAASSTLLGDNNAFSGVDDFTNASSNFGGTWQTFSPSHFQTAGTYLAGIGNYATTTATAISISTSTQTFDGLTFGNSFAISASGISVAPTVSGTLNNAGLAHSTIVVNGTTLTLGDIGDALTAASSTLLGDNNTFSGNDTFKLLNLSATSSSLLGVNASGEVVATTTIGTSLLAGALGTINGTTFSVGGSITVGSASTTLLSDNNTFSGANLFTASTTVGNGNQSGGLTVSGGATTTGNLVVQGSGTSTFLGNIGISGNIVPSTDNTYTLGSPSYEWKDVYIGPGSLFVNGQEVVHTDASQNVVLTANSNQNLEMQTSGTGSVLLNSSGTGNIQLAGPVQITGGENFSTSNSTPVLFSDGVEPGNLELTGNAIQAANTNGGISFSPNGNGSTYFTDGNVGIGTTNPLSKLEVEGAVAAQNFSATSTTATSTFADGINLTGGCFAVNATCVGASSASTTLLSDTNTFSGVDSFTNASSNFAGTWQGLSPSHFDTFAYPFPINATTTTLTFSDGLSALASTTIGNGTQSGGLTISGGATTTANFLVQGTLASQGSASIGTTLAINGTTGTTTIAGGQGFTIGGSQFVVQQGSGNVGIGTTSPAGHLGINAELNGSGPGLYIDARTRTTGDNVFYLAGSSAADDIVMQAGGNVGIGTTSPSTLLSLTGGGGNYFDSSGHTGFGLAPVSVYGTSLQIPQSLIAINDSNTSAGGSIMNLVLANTNGATGTSANIEFASKTVSGNIEGSAQIGAVFTASNAFGLTGNVYPASDLVFYTGGNGGTSNSAPTERMRITSAGNVGIGRSNPTTPLDVFGANTGYTQSSAGGLISQFIDGNSRPVLQIRGGIDGSALSNDAVLNVGGEGVTSYSIDTVGGINVSPVNHNSSVFSGNVYLNETSEGAPGRLNLAFNSNIEQGITILNTNNSAFNGYDIRFQNSSDSNIGSVSESNTGVAYNTTSDRRLKENIATTTAGLATLMQVPVDNFDFINDPTHTQVQGFIAQSLYPIYPEAVTTNGDNGIVPLGPTSTPWEVDYGRLTPLIVSAVQDIANISSTFEQNLIAWLGNAQNGIGEFFAQVGNFQTTNAETSNASTTNTQTLNVQQVCVGDSPTDPSPVCVTKAQLAVLMSQTATAQAPESVTSSASNSSDPAIQNPTPEIPESVSSATSSASQSATSTGSTAAGDTPPVIQVNGDNPAIIQAGATYNDLGATITGPQADLNLGIQTFVNGAAVSPLQIDTSAVATDTIDYVATDQNGLTSTGTRIVIIEAPSIAPSDGDAATTSAATSTSS